MTASKPTKPRIKRGELPKPVIRQDSFGFLPFNAVSASYLYNGIGDLILGYRETEQTLRLKARTMIPLVEPGKPKAKHELDINGRFFNGLTDALYRGKLPQVLLVAPHPDDWQSLLVDIVEYMERLLSLGFFVPKKEIIKRDLVEDLVPCFILVGEGMVFTSFMTGLTHYLAQLEKQHPTFEPAMKARILGKFVRGFAGDNNLLTLPEAEPANQEGAAFTLLPVPRIIRIAGGSAATLNVIQSVLSLYSLTVVIENRVRNSPERLELENAWERITRVVLPSVFTTEESKQLTSKVGESILAIGRQRQAFEAVESLAAVPVATNKSKHVTLPGAGVKSTDAVLLQGLSVTADRLGLTTEKQLFEALASKVFEQIK